MVRYVGVLAYDIPTMYIFHCVAVGCAYESTERYERRDVENFFTVFVFVVEMEMTILGIFIFHSSRHIMVSKVPN